MNLQGIEERVATLDSRQGVDFLFELLRAYGIPKASISRLRSGQYDKSDAADEVLWRNKVYFRSADLDDGDLYAAIDSARSEERILDQRPRFLILTNSSRLIAADLTAGDTLDIQHGELADHATFFLPWAGIEKTRIEEVNPADIKAAEKMARLYDEITRHNTIESSEQIHDLNVFFSRLLFCFFAEDTGVFEQGSFTIAVGSYTQGSGEDLHVLLDELFAVLDRPVAERDGVPAHLTSFGYVNGSLFEHRKATPRFTAKARKVILECGTLDWSQINPDIFGSMIQAVVHRGQREALGIHYTSVENIMKVIRPLFLDELEEELAVADTIKKLDVFIDRLSRVQVFDPACGSGNFLVIAYKELRRLEHRALERIGEVDPSRVGLFKLSRIELDSFYGIEIDDFAHEVAILSLWLAKHQMNLEFEELFGAEIPLIPLRDAGNVVCGNAARLEWSDACDASGRPTFVLGNPPYAGSRTQTQEQKSDFAAHFSGAKYPKDLDYIALWFLKGTEYLRSGPAVEVAFVSTNSATQGEQIALMWPLILAGGAHISFAHSSFRWTNQARDNPGVSCVVVGLCAAGAAPRNALYAAGVRRTVSSISPYLLEGPGDLIVRPRRQPLSALPPMAIGSKPVDAGHLILNEDEANRLVVASPEAERFIRRYGGSREALNGNWRKCLWISDSEAALVESPEIRRRLDLIRAFRAASRSANTREHADRPYRFIHRAHRDTSAILVPEVSSERREYIPMDFVGADTVVSNKAYVVHDAKPWLFGLIQSRMHMAWIRAVSGRLESRYSYSAGLVYNTFPVPALTDAAKQELQSAAVGVLGAREQFAGNTLAELYDPDQMPGGLREAHRALDEAVDRLYRKRPFESDEERLQLLFGLYEAATDVGADDDA